jgi:7-cyano-7-deazaguanine synthase in queuosine biosynthesis
MRKPQLELADVVRRFLGAYQEQFGDLMLPSHHRALQDIVQCMTETMGGGRYHCKDCDETFWCYHGCRNRSCPKCHGRPRFYPAGISISSLRSPASCAACFYAIKRDSMVCS